jgi:hypothetical protein
MAAVVAIDRTKSDRVVFTCPHELRQAMADYRRAQPDFPSESKVIVDLIRRGLDAWRKEREEESASASR